MNNKTIFNTNYCCLYNSSIYDVIKLINISKLQASPVIDEDTNLLGIVTDGDIRRAILNGIDFNNKVTNIMAKNPIYAKNNVTRSEVLSIMQLNKIRHLPIVDDNKKVIDVVLYEDLLTDYKLNNPVLLMAGGKGERLMPLTRNCPKPMLELHGKPILESILMQCIDVGLSEFYISVNFLKERIMEYFQDGSKWNVKINYIIEDKPYGTCGCLSLLNHDLQDDMLVINGDIITKLEVDRLLRFHKRSCTAMTVCSRNYQFDIQYAVMSTKGHHLTSLDEKPSYNYQVNAGVYVLSKEIIKKIPSNYFNMTDLIDSLLIQNKDISVFPIHEDWLDVGNHADFLLAQNSN